MGTYLRESVDDLPFGGPEKARRYATERYAGAVGLNWYTSDPTLQFLMRRHLSPEGLDWAAPHLDRVGALMGGPITDRAERTDKNPPRLVKYDRWGHDISHVEMPESFEANRRDLLANNFTSPEFIAEAGRRNANPVALGAAWYYLLCQAEIGMMCALGTGGDMVVGMAELFAPEDIKERVRALFKEGYFSGEAAQMFTERTGGSDLGAMETTATPDGDDAWRLNGFKWFASNANGSAFVVLAKPAGARDDVRGVVPFLVLLERRDGARNGVRIRRLKDKLGTRAVASAEIEFADAEAFMLAPSSAGGMGDGKGLGRMMELTNGARLGIAMMGLGGARRALVESLRYAGTREAFGARLIDQPLMKRKLADMIVEVEAAQALVFDGYLGPRLRIGAPLIKLRAARLGITVASDAIEIHGGNGYIEDWPVARVLRDAQVNPIWEGPDNILCLDVRRAMAKEEAHLPLLERLRTACASSSSSVAGVVSARVDDLSDAIAAWQKLDPVVAEARLFPLAQFMVDVYAAAVLLEHAEDDPTGHKELIARLYARSHMEDRGRLRGVDDAAEDLERFSELYEGALSVESR